MIEDWISVWYYTQIVWGPSLSYEHLIEIRWNHHRNMIRTQLGHSSLMYNKLIATIDSQHQALALQKLSLVFLELIRFVNSCWKENRTCSSPAANLVPLSEGHGTDHNNSIRVFPMLILFVSATFLRGAAQSWVIRQSYAHLPPPHNDTSQSCDDNRNYNGSTTGKIRGWNFNSIAIPNSNRQCDVTCSSYLTLTHVMSLCHLHYRSDPTTLRYRPMASKGNLLTLPKRQVFQFLCRNRITIVIASDGWRTP